MQEDNECFVFYTSPKQMLMEMLLYCVLFEIVITKEKGLA